MAMGTAAAEYEFDGGSVVGVRGPLGGADGVYGWSGDAVGLSPKTGAAAGFYAWEGSRGKGENGEILPDDRFRVIVQESLTGEITGTDVIVTNLIHQRALSAPCDIQCDVDFRDNSVAGIYFKPWEQYIHIEKVILGKRRLWCTAIVQPSDIDEQTGVLHLRAKGFACYPKGLPWLEDINWLVNDAFDPVVRIWQYLQSYPNGNLNVDVRPKASGVEVLPGYGYDGNQLNINFVATFVRAVDKLDCGDYIDALARDTPFDYREHSEWNADRTDVIKTLELGYPRLGLIQETLAFIINENVITAKPHTETQTDWISDVGVTGFFPGFEFSFELANADPNRLRRYLDEQDAFIDSNERAAAWAHRRLARRQTPHYWEQITINPNHPNAPFGSFDVGDTITVTGFMPWVGDVVQDHKIIAISTDVTKSVCQLTLKAEGAFNYDPIFFPDGVTNIIDNTGFDHDLQDWTASGPGWSWDGEQGASRLGTATITADGTDHDLLTDAFGVDDLQIFPLAIQVKCAGAVSSADSVQLVAQFYDDDITPTTAFEIAGIAPRGAVAWRKLAGKVIAPPGSTHVALRLHVGAAMTAGQVWFDDAELTI